MNRRDRLKADKEYLERAEWLFDDSFEDDKEDEVNRAKELVKYMDYLEVNTDVLRLVNKGIKYLLEGNDTMFKFFDKQLQEYLEEEE